jgi:hypothetical protein
LSFKPNTKIPWWLQQNNIISRNAEIFQNYLFERTNSCEEKIESFQGILIFGNEIYNWA